MSVTHLVAGSVRLPPVDAEGGGGLDVDQPALVRVDVLHGASLLGPRGQLLVLSLEARVHLQVGWGRDGNLPVVTWSSFSCLAHYFYQLYYFTFY